MGAVKNLKWFQMVFLELSFIDIKKTSPGHCAPARMACAIVCCRASLS